MAFASSVCKHYKPCSKICGGKADKYGKCTPEWCELNKEDELDLEGLVW